MKVAIYARYSSDQQRDASIADQVRECRLFAKRQGWTVVDEYSDHAVSGASLLRPGIQAALTAVARPSFDILMSEALDRISRDQEGIAAVFKRLLFAGVKLITLAEGEITELHVGLKGTMNAVFLKDLADKTRRGMRGRVEAGKVGGGLCYGYDLSKVRDSAGELLHGERVINAAEAGTILRIFKEYAVGKSSRMIAWELNKERILGPSGRDWGPSTIHGSTKRQNGVLNNELYIGRLVWNRQRFLKNPDTGKRVSRPNPQEDWVVHEVPHLRIVDDELWQAVKARQAATTIKTACRTDNPLLERRRPKHLFAGLVKCGCCGGGYMMISKDLLGCASCRNKGTCLNRLNIRRDALEASVLSGLGKQLMEPELFREFCQAFTSALSKGRIEERTRRHAWQTELAKVERQIRSVIEAIKDGYRSPDIKEELVGLTIGKLNYWRRWRVWTSRRRYSIPTWLRFIGGR